MNFLELCKQIPDNDNNSFRSYTSKWINYVRTETKSSDIPQAEWDLLFGRTNPVAGIDRGELLDVAKYANGERITNEKRSIIYNWDDRLLPLLKTIINPDNEDRIKRIKEVRDVIRTIILENNGRNMKIAINRLLTTFCPDILIRIPDEKRTKEFIRLLKNYPDFHFSLNETDDWIDNSYNLMKVLKECLGESIQKKTIWDIYEYIKKVEGNAETVIGTEIIERNMTDKYVSLLKANKNLILTGAPGTGKTYMAKEIAKAMGCTEKEIGFVQFHPSYDYTDFVEGLRPNGDGGEIGFERRDGVFKKFCKEAIGSPKKHTSTFDEAFEGLCFDIKDGIIETITLKSGKYSSKLSVSGNNIIRWEAPNSGNPSVNVVSRERLRKLYREYDSIEKLKVIGNINDAIRDVIGGCNTTMYYALLKEVLLRISKLKTGTWTEFISEKNVDKSAIKREPAVFIIDEINRGEISKIFGELFFSIDPGYRGEKGKVNTQYQNMIEDGDVFKDGFYVPENVYIIGTMNDIDRSVESMDFAMRRRFAWQEVTAEESYSNMIENDPEFADVKDEIKQRMFSLNKAIAETEGLDEAYQIGAAYFRKYLDYQDKSNPFECLWNNHLNGLLFEYLRGNRRAKELLEKLHKAYNKTSNDEQPAHTDEG